MLPYASSSASLPLFSKFPSQTKKIQAQKIEMEEENEAEKW